jgi:hypothetical protein
MKGQGAGNTLANFNRRAEAVSDYRDSYIVLNAILVKPLAAIKD